MNVLLIIQPIQKEVYAWRCCLLNHLRLLLSLQQQLQYRPPRLYRPPLQVSDAMQDIQALTFALRVFPDRTNQHKVRTHALYVQQARIRLTMLKNQILHALYVLVECIH